MISYRRCVTNSIAHYVKNRPSSAYFSPIEPISIQLAKRLWNSREGFVCKFPKFLTPFSIRFQTSVTRFRYHWQWKFDVNFLRKEWKIIIYRRRSNIKFVNGWKPNIDMHPSVYKLKLGRKLKFSYSKY